jgi:hypothetical protein
LLSSARHRSDSFRPTTDWGRSVLPGLVRIPAFPRPGLGNQTRWGRAAAALGATAAPTEVPPPPYVTGAEQRQRCGATAAATATAAVFLPASIPFGGRISPVIQTISSLISWVWVRFSVSNGADHGLRQRGCAACSTLVELRQGFALAAAFWLGYGNVQCRALMTGCPASV